MNISPAGRLCRAADQLTAEAAHPQSHQMARAP
jgi:hypothetical protein